MVAGCLVCLPAVSGLQAPHAVDQVSIRAWVSNLTGDPDPGPRPAVGGRDSPLDPAQFLVRDYQLGAVVVQQGTGLELVVEESHSEVEGWTRLAVRQRGSNTSRLCLYSRAGAGHAVTGLQCRYSTRYSTVLCLLLSKLLLTTRHGCRMMKRCREI